MKQPPIPTPAEAVRLVFQRACLSISREYALLAKTVDAPTSHEAAVAWVKARRVQRPAEK